MAKLVQIHMTIIHAVNKLSENNINEKKGK